MTAGAGAGGAPAGWLDVRGSAAVAGRFLAMELELHCRVGELAATVTEPAERRFLAAASMAHGWRACLFESLLPMSVGLPSRGELVVLPPADLRRLESLDVEVLLHDVYPRLQEEYEAVLVAVSRVSDGPLALAAARAAGDLRRVAAERPGHRTSQTANLLRG